MTFNVRDLDRLCVLALGKAAAVISGTKSPHQLSHIGRPSPRGRPITQSLVSVP
jgi:hypothetical protein